MSSRARRPEDFLELVERARRGRLKLYVGFAAGVGKTYRMLQEAQDLKKRGVDVVVAFVEPHDRAETTALVAGLEVVPRKRLEYRGVGVEEMDLDAVLARKPTVAVVDELPHTNAPGSKNRKRWQDVLALLDAGINVIGAMNVQHLESLNGLIERATGVTVRETVPDSFLKQADQIVNLDLAVEDLQERLQAGKIYAKEKIPWALENFFKDQNLATLRELALREVAESLDRAGAARGASDVKASGRIMVCLASNPPRAKALLSRGSRMAGRLNTDWYVVYVETPQEAPNLIDSEAQRHLLQNIEKAKELGAEVVRLKSDDPAQALLDFARTHGVERIIVGRSMEPWWKQILRGSVLIRLLREGSEFDLHIVAATDEERA
ncbi:MAG TPA: universal stress protein [Myxococcales bacterium]|nr:universal stress protein [Myxococcales bacterium]